MAIKPHTGGILITGTDIERYHWSSRLMAMRLELLGMKHSSRLSISAIIKESLGLPKSHQNRMAFMYANHVYYLSGIISESIWKMNIAYLRTRFND